VGHVEGRASGSLATSQAGQTREGGVSVGRVGRGDKDLQSLGASKADHGPVIPTHSFAHVVPRL
jgi:hypothetical protein